MSSFPLSQLTPPTPKKQIPKKEPTLTHLYWSTMKLIKMVLLTMTLSPCLLRSERGVRRVEIKEEENGKFLVFGSKERGNEVKEGGWPSPSWPTKLFHSKLCKEEEGNSLAL